MENREATTILLECQLDLLPIEGSRLGSEFVRGLFNGLNEPGFTDYAYQNLSLQSDPPTLSTTRSTERGKRRSECNIWEHAIGLEESSVAGVEIEDYLDKVKTIATVASETATKLKRPIPPVLSQTVCVQAIIQPSYAESPLLLLADNAASVFRRVTPFRRPPSSFGIRFRFMPHTPEDDDGKRDPAVRRPFEGLDEARDDIVTLRFETWSEDPSFIWMEASSSRYLSGEVIELEDPSAAEKVCRNIKETYDFLLQNGIGFIKQFDVKPDDDKEESDDETDDTEG